jgi:hypothetical protein
MLHQYAYAVREVFVWGKDEMGRPRRLGPGHALTDDDVVELEKPENAELLRRCTRVLRTQLLPDDAAPAAAPADAPKAATPPAPAAPAYAAQQVKE